MPLHTLIQHGVILFRVIKGQINYFKYEKYISVHKNNANLCKIWKLNYSAIWPDREKNEFHIWNHIQKIPLS